MLVDVHQELYDKVKKIVKERDVEYASIKHFVDLAVKEKVCKCECNDRE